MADEDPKAGTAGDGGATGPGTGTSTADAGTPGAQGAGAEDSFIDPSTLPAELKPHWKRMHGAYTKSIEATRALKEKASLVDQFYGNSDFALQTVQEWAKKAGYTLTREGAAAVAAAGAGAGPPPPPEMVAAIKARLDPSLAWMAESIAAAHWAAQQLTEGPRAAREQDERLRARNAEYDEHAEALTNTAPGWEQHEDDMLDLMNFLSSDAMAHRKWGSKLALLYNLVTGNAAAIRDASRRMGEAVRGRTVAGTAGRQSGPDLSAAVRGAKTNQEAWGTAAKQAIADLERRGIPLPP